MTSSQRRAGDAEVRVIGLRGIPMVEEGDDLAVLTFGSAMAQGTALRDRDVLVLAQRIVSKAEGRVVPLDNFVPSPFALAWAREWDKDPRQIEAVLRESRRIVRQRGGVLIAETRHGFICANAGVDASNVGGKGLISLLPVNPDASARALRDAARTQLGIDIAVIVTDTFGRPWRQGETNVAIGLAGLRPLRPLAGAPDIDGREMLVSMPCVADEIAATAGLVMLKTASIPAAIVRGYPYEAGEGSAREIVRPPDMDLFP